MWLLLSSPGSLGIFSSCQGEMTGQKRCIKDVSNLSGRLGSPAQEGERLGEDENLQQAQGVAWLPCPPEPLCPGSGSNRAPSTCAVEYRANKHVAASPEGGC